MEGLAVSEVRAGGNCIVARGAGGSRVSTWPCAAGSPSPASSTHQAVCPPGLFRPWDKGRLKPEPRLKITQSADPLRARGGSSKWGKLSLGLAPLPPELVGPSVSQEKPLLTQAWGGQVHRLPPVLGLPASVEPQRSRPDALLLTDAGLRAVPARPGLSARLTPARGTRPSQSSRRDAISSNLPAFSPAQVRKVSAELFPLGGCLGGTAAGESNP